MAGEAVSVKTTHPTKNEGMVVNIFKTSAITLVAAVTLTACVGT
jgi:hypothetical protein